MHGARLHATASKEDSAEYQLSSSCVGEAPVRLHKTIVFALFRKAGAGVERCAFTLLDSERQSTFALPYKLGKGIRGCCPPRGGWYLSNNRKEIEGI